MAVLSEQLELLRTEKHKADVEHVRKEHALNLKVEAMSKVNSDLQYQIESLLECLEEQKDEIRLVKNEAMQRMNNQSQEQNEISPNRYVFPGAEVFDKEDDSDSSSGNSDSDTDSDDEASDEDPDRISGPDLLERLEEQNDEIRLLKNEALEKLEILDEARKLINVQYSMLNVNRETAQKEIIESKEALEKEKLKFNECLDTQNKEHEFNLDQIHRLEKQLSDKSTEILEIQHKHETLQKTETKQNTTIKEDIWDWRLGWGFSGRKEKKR